MPSFASLILQLKQALGLIDKLRMDDTNRIKLYEAAYNALDQDASPLDHAPDELACAESINEIYKAAFGEYLYVGNKLSTYFLRKALRESPLFRLTNLPAPGDVIISPTGFGTRKRPNGSLVIPNGHVGIVMFGSDIASNDSRPQYKGKFRINYTLDSWAERWVRQGGYPLEIYRRV
jgi:hypothetical protein